jgi:UDP-glucose 4-epimerase
VATVVIGLDNYSKYGPVKRSYDDHPHYRFVEVTPGTST